MRFKLTKEENEFKNAHVFRLKRNAVSQSARMYKSDKYTRFKIMDEPENRDDKIIAFLHPLRSY